jgi:hypothetical protein
MPPSFSRAARPRNDCTPSDRSFWIVGARSMALLLALAIRTPLALARSVQVPARPRKPPRDFPRAFAAANAALVRSDMAWASCSATAARIWIVSRFAVGKSTAWKSTPGFHEVRDEGNVPGQPVELRNDQGSNPSRSANAIFPAFLRVFPLRRMLTSSSPRMRVNGIAETHRGDKRRVGRGTGGLLLAGKRDLQS